MLGDGQDISRRQAPPGVGTLINVINKLGGIAMVSDFLTSLMGPKSATPILAATSFAAAISPLSTGGAINVILSALGVFSLGGILC